MFVVMHCVYCLQNLLYSCDRHTTSLTWNLIEIINISLGFKKNWFVLLNVYHVFIVFAFGFTHQAVSCIPDIEQIQLFCVGKTL